MKVKITADRQAWKNLRCPVCGDWLEPDIFGDMPTECANCGTTIIFEDGDGE